MSTVNAKISASLRSTCAHRLMKEGIFMALIHPVFALLAILACLVAFIIGAKHFWAVRKGRQAVFNRTRHIRAGSSGIILLLLSAVGGSIMADLLEIDMSIYHISGGMAAVILACSSGVSGWMLYKGTASQIIAHRATIKTIHAISGMLLMLAGLNQVITGAMYFLE